MADNQGADAVGHHVRWLLGHILGHAQFDGRDELLRQVGSVDVVAGPITMLDLQIAGTSLRSSASDKGPLPITAIVTDISGEEIGSILIWTTEGRLSALEFAWWTDEPPERLPLVMNVRVSQD